MRVLLSAYACEPGKGSEQEVGLQVMLAAAEQHDVWVLTRANSVPLLEEFLDGHPLRDRVRLHGLDVDGPLRTAKRTGLPGLHLYYEAWQRLAAQCAADLDRINDFDLVHHVTFATYWTRAGVSKLGKPFVWGPVGGGVTTPLSLVSELGVAGICEDALREAVRRLASRRPSHRDTVRAAAVCLVQNTSTARRLLTDRAVVAPNALTVRLTPAVLPQARGTDIAFVGRLVPWKAAALAVRTMRYVEHPAAVLRIFGDGPEARRVRRLAERHGVQDRVELVGSLSRSELLQQVARCGVLLHPALHDESPIAVGEALSLGVPVVCLDHGGPAEIVRWWPGAPVSLVTPAGPRATAVGLARGVDSFLSEGSVAPTRPVPPRASFATLLLDAYDEAVARAMM